VSEAPPEAPTEVATPEPASPEPVSDEALLARFQNAKRRPPATDTIGFKVVRVDQARREIEVTCEGRPAFCNPAGQVQGGFLMAMLDEAMSVAGVVASGMTAFIPTLEMKTSFYRPALPGRLRLVARVAKWGRQVCFMEGELYDAEDRLVAKATSTGLPQPYKRATGRE
jgi:uncharacterized protein (TIGR00369 family)